MEVHCAQTHRGMKMQDQLETTFLHDVSCWNWKQLTQQMPTIVVTAVGVAIYCVRRSAANIDYWLHYYYYYYY